ncbi:hypothetical protein G5B40_07480 [Pikeienuella piscinae]|uniref:Membrane-associated oxidoreductase n=1 Tax=Pikeienuella piscinae TaxID=2748098 RepID=A0A7L5C0E3_9RHOB|nr:hypothetical protein [Pikeienuella piscinae]QIE55309.1 hypothetical protein G5B40_07480 [Pikeienuella piscinae]
MTEPRKLADFGGLTPAEQKVLDELDSGAITRLGDGKRPEADAGPDRRIRPAFLRWCALGAGEGRRVHESGVRIRGALIANDAAAGRTGWKTRLDLEGCALDHDLGLYACRFVVAPLLRSASLQNLFLNDSALPGFSADRLRATGGVFLRKVETTGEVRLSGAALGGDLSLPGAKLSNKAGAALFADRLQAKGGIFLRDAESVGEMRLLGVKIGGNLECSNAKLSNATGAALSADRLDAKGGVFLRKVEAEGEVRLPGVELGGDIDCAGAQLSNPGKKALNLGGANVTGVFFLRRAATIEGALDLTAARLGAIDDDPSCWPASRELLLNRCRYGAFTGVGVDATSRIRWLRLQDATRYGKDFWPQPWEHCAKVLREMGHAEDARAVLIEKERLQRADRRRRIGTGWRRWTTRFIDLLLDQTVRFGHQPLRAFLWLFLLLGLGAAIFLAAWRVDAMKPNNAFVLRAPEWVGCAETAPPWTYRGGQGSRSQLDCFLRQPEAQGFPEFNALIYAADVLFPLVDIEQQSYWTPNEDMTVGAIAKVVVYLNIILGWALSLLAVAGFSGLVKSD